MNFLHHTTHTTNSTHHITYNTNTTHTTQQNGNNSHSTAFSNSQQSLPLQFEVHVSKVVFSHFFRGCHDHERGPEFTSLSQAQAWLKTLPDVSEDVELRRIQEAVQGLQKPTQQAVEHICAQWQQATKHSQRGETSTCAFVFVRLPLRPRAAICARA